MVSGTIIITNMTGRSESGGSGRRRWGSPAFVMVALTLLVAAAVGACGTSSGAGSPTGAAGSGRTVVVAAENFWGDIAAQIGGDRVVVTSIVKDPGVDPHLYESSTRDAAAVDQARVVIRNGLVMTTSSTGSWARRCTPTGRWSVSTRCSASTARTPILTCGT
jgi:hypothetical protein